MTTPRGLPTESTLILSNEPQIGDWLPNWLSWLSFLFQKPEFQKQDVRPVFFGTDTILGIKIAWSGMTGQFPDSAKFGYNRKELALVPISYEKDTTATTPIHKMKMSSLLATVDTGAIESPKNTGGPSLPYKHLQYFATGDAATLLALQRDFRLAMLARLDPNGELRKNQFLSSLGGANAPLVSQIVYDVQRVLKAQPNDTRAQQLLADLDAMAKNYAFPNIDFYKEETNDIVSASPSLKQRWLTIRLLISENLSTIQISLRNPYRHSKRSKKEQENFLIPQTLGKLRQIRKRDRTDSCVFNSNKSLIG